MEERQKSDGTLDCYVLHIARHNTAQKGPSLRFLTEFDVKALEQCTGYLTSLKIDYLSMAGVGLPLTHHGEFICPLRGLIFNPPGCPTHPPH